MKQYPPVNAADRRAQNPGPLPVDKVGASPLRKGDSRSNLVIHLQKMLFELGYLLGSNSSFLDGVDGVFGNDTFSAVQEYQRDHLDFDAAPLVVDGIVGERTGDSLNREMVGIWYGSYASTDRSGNPVPAPPNPSLITIDIDDLLANLALLLTSTNRLRVVVHFQGTFPNFRTDRSANFIPNDPEISGPIPPVPAPPFARFLSKETHLFHLHSANQPTWAISDQPPPVPPIPPPAPGTPIPIPLLAFVVTGPQRRCVHFPNNPAQNFPEPGRFPAGTNFPGTTGDFQFQRSQCHLTVARSIRTWKMRGFSFGGWRSGGPGIAPPLTNPLNITLQDAAANLGGALNAFYNRPNQLRLGFNGTVFTADSADTVGHETGHAILDAVAPALFNSPVFEAGAFHEAFGDITAVMNALGDPDVREELVRSTARNLAQTNLVSKVAEAFGRFVGLGGPLRDVFTANPQVNPNPPPPNFPFNYRDPATLPAVHGAGRTDANEVINEFHSFSVVFSTAFYDSLINAFVRLTPAGASDDDIDAALREAAGSLGAILARAIIRRPAPQPAPPPTGANPHPVRSYYWLLAREMFRVDGDRFASRFRNDLIGTGPGNGFVGRDLIRRHEI